MNIYVATDQDGIIRVTFNSGQAMGIYMGGGWGDHSEMTIRPITVTTTDGIVGKSWEEVDETMLMLRECNLDKYDHENNVGRSAQFDEGVWKVREDECFENQSTDTIDMCHTMLVKTPDLHTALTHLTSKEA
ncbi:MAG: hypothetical protein JSS75_07270 [Bacteroidetes bacterium]|nr:hypothetical protein [Bacteroidota bacterium]